jgi:SulP family sulfate permease
MVRACRLTGEHTMAAAEHPSHRFRLAALLHHEFRGYGRASLQRDIIAGLTVGTVALPLALAFGVAGGATAAAGMVTAIVGGALIALLGGTSFQVSGPTGAMSAVLIVLSQRYGLSGIWVAGMLAGMVLILLGAFRLGRYIAFIPSPVITGFTSGIAVIIALGQIDNVLGVAPRGGEAAVDRLWHLVTEPPPLDWHAMAVAAIVIVTMLVLPRLRRDIPASLIGIIAATAVVAAAGWQVARIGSIPQTIILDERLTLATIPWAALRDVLPAAISIAALGAIESLLCGTVGSTMTGAPMDSNQELIAQGIGNLVLPFVGGIPATAAIARTSVAIKSGGATRITSIVHAALLFISVIAIGPWISQIPLAALGGVLLVTAWRMNEWESIMFFARRRIGHALAGMLVTMLATVVLDLTQAILIGLTISALMYVRQSAGSVDVRREGIDLARMRAQGHQLEVAHPDVHVYYLTGPIFFGSVHTVLEAFADAGNYRVLVISMRGVPVVDVMGAQALTQIVELQQRRGGLVFFSGVQPAVRQLFERTGLLALIGEDRVVWSADRAIMAVDALYRREAAGEPSR